MVEGVVGMSVREQERLVVLRQVEAGGMTLQEGAARMGVSYRQAKRLRAGLRQRGASALAHGLRGRASNRRVDEALVERALGLYRTRYADFGPTLAVEKLAEEHGVSMNRETLRRRLHEAHLLVTGRRLRTHRRARARRERFGEMVQMDGSHHAWFEERGAPCCLLVLVDDATSRVEAFFAAEETTDGAFGVLRRWIGRYGVPQSLYVDRKSLYYEEREPTAQERRQGVGACTAFGRACARLGIHPIFAHSPQAKGRVERMNGTLQDRLVKELRLRGISDIDAANAFLPGYLQSLNERFAVDAASRIDAHRRRPSADTLNDVLCHETTRVLQRDFTVRWGATRLQILRQTPLPAPGARLTLRRCFDGRMKVLEGERPLRYAPLPLVITWVAPPPRGRGNPSPAYAG